MKNDKEYFLDTILPPFNLDVVTGKGMDLINLVSQLEIIQNISDILVKVPNQTKEHLSEFFKSCPFTANHAALIFEPERKGSFLTWTSIMMFFQFSLLTFMIYSKKMEAC